MATMFFTVVALYIGLPLSDSPTHPPFFWQWVCEVVWSNGGLVYLLWPISHIYSLFPIISSVSFVLGAWSNSKHGRASRGTAGDEDSAMPRLALLALIKTCWECLKFICQVLLRPRSNWPPLSRIALIAHIKLAAIVFFFFQLFYSYLWYSLYSIWGLALTYLSLNWRWSFKFSVHPPGNRVILDTYDAWDMWSEWWRYMTNKKKPATTKTRPLPPTPWVS